MLADRCHAGVLFTATQSVPIQDWVDKDTWHDCKQDHALGPEQRVEMVVLRHQTVYRVRGIADLTSANDLQQIAILAAQGCCQEG